jgi:hypothetical protein
VSFDTGRSISPSLFKTLHGSGRDAEQSCHLALALPQVTTRVSKLSPIHDNVSEPILASETQIFSPVHD